MGDDLNPPPLSLLETVLYAPDLTAIVAFNRRVLGLEPFAIDPARHVFYKCGNQMLLFFNPNTTMKPGFVGGHAMPLHGTTGQGHVCFRASVQDLDTWRTRLEELDVEIEADFEWPQGGRSIYFRDPAGNVIEFAEARIWGLA